MLLFVLLKIFLARIIDVSIGTFRTILTVRGKVIIPTILAFFEVLVWFYVAKEALLVEIDSILIPISYSFGYATGSLIGTLISRKLINQTYEIKIFNYNKKQLDYIKSHQISIHKFSINSLIIFINKKESKLILNDLHKYSKKSIIYISEVKQNYNLQSRNNML